MLSKIPYYRLLLLMMIIFVGFTIWQTIPNMVELVQMMKDWSTEKITAMFNMLFVYVVIAALAASILIGLMAKQGGSSCALLIAEMTCIGMLLLFPMMFIAYFNPSTVAYTVWEIGLITVGLFFWMHSRYQNRAHEVALRKEKKWAAIRASKET